jgi:hypothetical protein
MKMERAIEQPANTSVCVAQRYVKNRVFFTGGLAMSGNDKNKSITQMADKNWFIVMAIVLVCLAFSPPQAGADTWLQRQKLLAGDGAASDYFGYSVSISGDFAIAGAYADDDNGSASGSAYIFEWDGANWSQQAKLLASDGAASDYFGYSVSISGDFAIAGAYGDDDKGSNSGSAYIFKRDGETWSQQQKLLASDGAAGDYFGYSVSISGNKAIAGAYNDVSAAGSAYIFMRCPTADLSGDDCFVDFVDFAVLGSQWFQSPGVPSADIAPQGGDDAVNFLDLAILVNEWLQYGE